MNTLFFNIVSHKTLIAVISNDKVLALKEGDERISDDKVIPEVKKVLDDAEIDFPNLNKVACIIGPGGFTSLRIAVAFVNTLCDQLGIPSAPVHLSDFVLSQASDSPEIWIHSTKKDLLFIKGNKWKEPTLISLEDLKSFLSSSDSSIWTGELIDDHISIFEEFGWKQAGQKSVNDFLSSFVSNLKYDDQLLLPWYGREG
ncbi:MAG: hypothetical protein KAS32_22895 [Candidatus Peribacteraceae bacterium]|nr:hypothetical protein [Candidatus Peribacteraceae bacterium]